MLIRVMKGMLTMLKKVLAAMAAVIMCAFVAGCRQQSVEESTTETTTVVESVQETTVLETQATKDTEETTASKTEAETIQTQTIEKESENISPNAPLPVDESDIDDLTLVEPQPATSETTKENNGELKYDSDGFEELE